MAYSWKKVNFLQTAGLHHSKPVYIYNIHEGNIKQRLVRIQKCSLKNICKPPPLLWGGHIVKHFSLIVMLRLRCTFCFSHQGLMGILRGETQYNPPYTIPLIQSSICLYVSVSVLFPFFVTILFYLTLLAFMDLRYMWRTANDTVICTRWNVLTNHVGPKLMETW